MKLTPEAEQALAELGVAIRTAVDDGQHVPCLGFDDWISDDAEDLVAAAYRCRRCPVIGLCRTAAQLSRPTAGVWAGINYLTPTARRNAA